MSNSDIDFQAGIIDQRVSKLAQDIRSEAQTELGITQSEKLHSLAFVYLCVQTMLDLSPEETFDCLTEGGGDYDVDAIHASETIDGSFMITLFQGKYKRNLKGDSNFPETAIKSMLYAISALFNPYQSLGNVNRRLRLKIEDIRSRIGNGELPQVRVFACNNGLPWKTEVQTEIDQAMAKYHDQLSWEHVNHVRLIQILQRTQAVKESLQLVGPVIAEDLNFIRLLVGRISIHEIYRLMSQYGDRLLDRNIRRYLGLSGNRVNEAIQKTLNTDPDNFYFYNNGITMICDKFSFNKYQENNHRVNIEDLQIINGGQSCMTIFKTLSGMLPGLQPEASVLVRIYMLPSDQKDLVNQITYATNSQNPVDLKDLKANDEIQKRLEMDIQQLGYTYLRKRSDTPVRQTDITSGTAAEAVLSVWRQRPQQAKYMLREHFGKLYSIIFTPNLTGTQIVIATLLYRIAENRRKRPHQNDPDFVAYASCFAAMQMGKYLLTDLDKPLSELDHRVFEEAKSLAINNGEAYFARAVQDIQTALNTLYGQTPVSLQQLAATFRRGDLIGLLP